MTSADKDARTETQGPVLLPWIPQGNRREPYNSTLVPRQA